VPNEPTWRGLGSVLPPFLSYLLSFVYVGIYWNNHDMIHLASRVNGAILWANLHLLFWLSLIPFTTRWMDESGFVQIPVLTYGINLLHAAIAYFILEHALIRQQGRDGPAGNWPGLERQKVATDLLRSRPVRFRLTTGPLSALDFLVQKGVGWLLPSLVHHEFWSSTNGTVSARQANALCRHSRRCSD
jgi:hypothetical protein